ncbi:MAG: hypothetical protein ABSH44_04980 [Bryobacteraceae bacterium]|jgi:hypothetical protein
MCPAENGGAKKPRVNVTRSLRDVIRDVAWLEKRRRKDSETTERALWELYQIEKALESRRSRTVTGCLPMPRDLPLPTLQDFQIVGAENGPAVVTLDNAKQVTLPRTLAVLAAILASDEGGSPDDLVAWKSFERVGELLKKRLGRSTFNHHALSQLLWRLRESLGNVAADGRRLVQSVPALGVRLRLQRRPGTGGLCAG